MAKKNNVELDLKYQNGEEDTLEDESPDLPDWVLDSPDLVQVEVRGKVFSFWLCEAGVDRAKEMKPDFDQKSDGAFTLTLWMGHLPFRPNMTFEAFKEYFRYMPYVDLQELVLIVNQRQGAKNTKAVNGKKKPIQKAFTLLR
jgi:hypothetical protein